MIRAVVQVDLLEDILDVAEVFAGLILGRHGAVLDEGADGADDGRVTLVVGQPPVVEFGEVPEFRQLGAQRWRVDVPVKPQRVSRLAPGKNRLRVRFPMNESPSAILQ